MKNPRKEIETWLASPKSEATGRALYRKYGSKPAVVRLIDQFSLRRLIAELQGLIQEPQMRKAKSGVQVIEFDTWTQSVKQREAATPKPEKTGVSVSIIKVNPGEYKALEKENARLYNMRALLSNRLVDPKDAAAVNENARIIAEIEEIVDAMKKNRATIRRMKDGEPEAITPEQKGDPAVVYLKDETYTLKELEAMDYENLSQLRERMRVMVAKAKKRSTDSKTQKFQVRNETKYVQKKAEWETVDRIYKQRQQ